MHQTLMGTLRAVVIIDVIATAVFLLVESLGYVACCGLCALCVCVLCLFKSMGGV